MISILIPTRGNRPGFLAEALASAERQHAGAEVEVVVEYDIEGTGQSATLNRAFARARGDWLTVLEDDDFYSRDDAVGLLLAQARMHPEADVVFSLPQYVNAEGQPIVTPPAVANWMAAHPRVRWDDLSAGLLVHGTGLLYSREAWESVGGWDETIPCCEEYEFHLHLLRAGFTFVGLPVPIMCYRIHPHQKSARRNGSGIGRTSARRRAVLSLLRQRYAELA